MGKPVKRHFDIRVYKKNLRKKYQQFRENLTPEEKLEKDAAILNHLYGTKEYAAATTVLTYVSLPSEIDTHGFINQCLADGKTVGVPYCITGTREMDFYEITSLDELEVRTYGVLEPVAEKAKKIEDFTSSICILPGLSFDKAGYRLGYGGGYYDRFLSTTYQGRTTIGICYYGATRGKLIHGRYDVPCHFIATERGVKKRGRYPESKGKRRGKRKR